MAWEFSSKWDLKAVSNAPQSYLKNSFPPSETHLKAVPQAPQSNRKDDSKFCAVRVWHKENQENRDPHLVPTDPHANSKLCPSDLFFPLNIRFPHKSAASKLSHMCLKEFAKLTPSFVRCVFGTRKTKKTLLFIYPEAASKLTPEVVSPIRAPLQSNPKSEREKS